MSHAGGIEIGGTVSPKCLRISNPSFANARFPPGFFGLLETHEERRSRRADQRVGSLRLSNFQAGVGIAPQEQVEHSDKISYRRGFYINSFHIRYSP